MIRSAVVSGVIFVVVLAVAAGAFAQEASTQPQSAPVQAPAAQNPVPPPVPATPAPEVFPKVQVFGGYSFLHEDTGSLDGTNFDVDLGIFPRSLVPRPNFNGFDAEAQYNFGPWVGAAVDVSGFNGFPFTAGSGISGLPNGSSYSILGGPVFSYRKLKSFTPFVHVLVGWNRTSVTSSALVGTAVPVVSSATTFNDFVLSPGGGLDWKISRRFALRLFQLDWFHTSLNLSSFYGAEFGTDLIRGFETNERNLRFSTGVVVNFK